jgi:hypothetical protein
MEKANQGMKDSDFFMRLFQSFGVSASEGAKASARSGAAISTDLMKIGHERQGFNVLPQCLHLMGHGEGSTSGRALVRPRPEGEAEAVAQAATHQDCPRAE